jgi:hypothetical protein
MGLTQPAYRIGTLRGLASGESISSGRHTRVQRWPERVHLADAWAEVLTGA